MAFLFRRKKKDLPSGLWTRCPECEQMIYTSKKEELLGVCPECNFHFPISAQERLEQLTDEGSWREECEDLRPCDPLGFRAKTGYLERLRVEQERTGQADAARVGRARLGGIEVVLTIIDAGFLMGSMGSVVGEKIARGAERAQALRVPYIVVSGSGGGARMQEGPFSLMQMAKTAAVLARLGDAGVPYLSVLTHPTMGGSMASFASLGDVIIAEPKALLGFTGPEVIRQTLRENLPEGFQRSEFLLARGFIDLLVQRDQLRDTLIRLCSYLDGARPFPAELRRRATTTRLAQPAAPASQADAGRG